MKTELFNVYEYPLKDNGGKVYYSSYTIKWYIKPLGFKGEKLVEQFKATVKA